jgi:YidC/Oxa1 family membrane protein insertase
MTLHDVSKVEMIAYPLINASVFTSFVYSIRTMISNGDDFQFVDGGLLWFKDLEQLDNTLVLPLAALSLSYYALNRAFAVSNGRPAILIKDLGHSLIILSVPWVAVLPSGVFCYWIPSSLFTLAQTTFLKSEVGMKLLRIPTLSLPPNSQSTQQKL